MAALRKMTSQIQSIFAIILTVFHATLATDNLIVTHSPSYLQFLPTTKQLPLSQVPDLLTSTYGFSPSHELTWDGLSQGSLFRRPKANVMFSFEGFKNDHSLTAANHIAHYSTQSDEKFVNTQAVSKRLMSVVESPLIIDFSAATSIFDVKAQYPELFSLLPGTPEDVLSSFHNGKASMLKYNLGSLNATQAADLVLLAELELIQEMIEALQSDRAVVQDNHPDLFHFRLGGFQVLTELYPAGHPAVADAKSLITQFLNQATEDFKKLYNNDVVVEVITLSGNHQPTLVRKGRSLMDAEDDAAATSFEQSINLAATWTSDYAAGFNIILWTMVVLFLIVLGVSCGMWNMDPGRDSIIYRMTSQRMKKD